MLSHSYSMGNILKITFGKQNCSSVAIITLNKYDILKHDFSPNWPTWHPLVADIIYSLESPCLFIGVLYFFSISRFWIGRCDADKEFEEEEYLMLIWPKCEISRDINNCLITPVRSHHKTTVWEHQNECIWISKDFCKLVYLCRLTAAVTRCMVTPKGRQKPIWERV